MTISFLDSLRQAARELERVDASPIPRRRGELRMFMIVRNESLRLPYLLRYYSRRGVDRLIVVDNDSTDGTLELLRAAANVHVYRTSASYAGHWRWMEYLLERHGLGHWCLVVDADEILRYPHADVLSLRDLCDFLAGAGHSGLHCLLLDMYSELPIAELRYRAGDDPLELCRCFDPDSHEMVTKSKLNRKSGHSFTYRSYHKGVRHRLFGVFPLLSKIPLFRHRTHTYPIQGMHAIDNVRLGALQGVLLHFKYLQDFGGRVAEEARRKVHYYLALDYRKMQERLSRDPVATFYGEASVRYEDDEQLLRLGLMRDEEAWRRLAGSRQAGETEVGSAGHGGDQPRQIRR